MQKNLFNSKRLLQGTVGTLTVISIALDIVEVDEKGIQSSVSVDRVTLTPCNARRKERTDHNDEMADAYSHKIEGPIDENGARVNREFPVPRIVEHVRTDK